MVCKAGVYYIVLRNKKNPYTRKQVLLCYIFFDDNEWMIKRQLNKHVQLFMTIIS